MGKEELITELKGKVGTITFNRAEKGNSLTWGMLEKLKETLERWANEDSICAVVFTGVDERAFCSGFDILSIPTKMKPELEANMKRDKPLDRALEAVKNFPYPTIAKINGYAFGAGLNLAVCCDFRFAVETVSVGMPPAKLGLVYHVDGLKQFLEIIGPVRTREVFYSANTYKGKEVKQIGLVDKLVSAGELDASVSTLIKQLEERAPLSLKGTKRILDMLIQNTMSLTASQTEEAENLVIQAIKSDDLKEGQRAFVEKRKPVFLGR